MSALIKETKVIDGPNGRETYVTCTEHVGWFWMEKGQWAGHLKLAHS